MGSELDRRLTMTCGTGDHTFMGDMVNGREVCRVCGEPCDDVWHLARIFRECIRAEADDATLDAIDHINAIRDDGSCATHDCMDANEIMDVAFHAAFGRECDPSSDTDLYLWDAAWTLARESGFARDAA